MVKMYRQKRLWLLSYLQIMDMSKTSGNLEQWENISSKGIAAGFVEDFAVLNVFADDGTPTGFTAIYRNDDGSFTFKEFRVN